MTIVDFDPVEHGAWVYTTFTKSAREPRAVLNRLLRHGMKCKVETGVEDPTLLIGFAVAAGQTVAWVYVKPKARGVGKGWRLLEAAGVDTGCPMLALYRSPACDGMIRDGKSIMYADEELEDATANE